MQEAAEEQGLYFPLDLGARGSCTIGGNLSAFEIMWGDYYRAVTGNGGHRAPLSRDHPYYVVLQAEGGDPAADADRFEAVLSDALEEERILDAVVAQSARDAGDPGGAAVDRGIVRPL